MKNKRFWRLFWSVPVIIALAFNGQLYATTPANSGTDVQNPVPVVSATATATPNNQTNAGTPSVAEQNTVATNDFLASSSTLSAATTQTAAQTQINAQAPTTSQSQSTPAQPINLTNAQLNNLQQIGMGPRVNAREASSFYASPLGSYLRDENGRLHLTYPGSGKYYDGTSQDPEWQATTKYATDRILYTYSDDNGQTWSPPVTIIEGFKNPDGSQKVEQSACTNSLVKYGDYYYLFFESFIPGDGAMMIGVYAARSRTIGGGYEIYTEKGWTPTTNGQTSEAWKPIIVPNLLRTATGRALAMQHYKPTQGVGNDFWGAGVPTARVENGKIILNYYDTTKGVTSGMPDFVALSPLNQSRMQVEITLDNTGNFLINNEGQIAGEARYTGAAQAVYFPEMQQYLMFSSGRINGGGRKIFLQVSVDGIQWSPKKEIGSYPALLTQLEQMGQGHARYDIRVLTDMNGNGKLSNLRLILGGDYVFPVREGYFAGFGELYEFKANLFFKSWDNDSNGIADAFDLNGDDQPDAWSNRPDGKINMWDSNNDGKADKFDTSGDGAPDNFDTNFDERVDAWSSRSDGQINMWDTDGNGGADVFDTNGDGKVDWGSKANTFTNAQVAYMKQNNIRNTVDLNADGIVDAWTNRPDGKVNMWDVDGNGSADVFDVDGDGIVDWGAKWNIFTSAQIAYMAQHGIRNTVDLNGDGKMDAWTNRPDGKINMWDTNFDGRIDAWSNRPDGKVNMWDVDGNGSADVFDVDGDGVVDWGSGWHVFTSAQIAYMNHRGIRYWK